MWQQSMIWLVVNLALAMTLLLLDHPQLRPMDIGSRSLYGSATAQPFNASSGGTIGKGSGFAGTRAVRAEESISLCNIVIAHTRYASYKGLQNVSEKAGDKRK